MDESLVEDCISFLEATSSKPQEVEDALQEQRSESLAEKLKQPEAKP